MSGTKELNQLLKDNGCVLIRQRKHLIYQLPNGRKFTMAKTPSCRWAAIKSVRVLKKALLQ